MKEIKKTRTIEEVVGYEAIDGTVFTNREECEKYEKLTAEEAIKNNFRKLIIGMEEEYKFCNPEGKMSFLGAGCGEGFGFALVKIQNENDFNVCNAYCKLVSPSTPYQFTKDMIGKEILVNVTDDYYSYNRENNTWRLNDCYVYGTIERQIEIYTERLMSIKDNKIREV